MTINLEGFNQQAEKAVKFFWKNRDEARQKQSIRGVRDQGTRSAVTAGKNMDGFVNLIREYMVRNGIDESDFITSFSDLVLPGFFRPVKRWDVLIINNSRLLAALEFKSQVGSFGNNFNNRCEEAIGNAVDLRTAYRESAYGDSPPPFVGYIMLLEDCSGSRKTVRANSPHFPMFPEFENTSYADRYGWVHSHLIGLVVPA
jgi:restriction endonuclease XhoI-like protein